MVTVTKVVNGLLEQAASDIFGAYSYFQVGTGTTNFVDSSVDLTSGTTFGSGVTRKIRDDTSTGSFLSGREMVMLFVLDPGEPLNQPLNLGEIGLFMTSGTTQDLGVGSVFNVVQIKDSTVKHRYRMSLRFNRIGEV